MKIRLATANDIPQIQRIGEIVWRDTYMELTSEEYILNGLEKWWSTEHFTQAIASPNDFLLVAEDDGKIIGIAQIQVSQTNLAWLWKLYVLTPYQRQGIGTTLLAESISKLPTRIDMLYTEFITGNSGAEKFYKSHGLQFDRTEKEGEATSITWLKKKIR